MPICTPAAPSANAAAMPRASAMPPAAITGTFTASTICGTSANVPSCRGDVVGQEHAAMAAGLGALRDDRVDAALLQPARLVARSSPTTITTQPGACTRSSSAAVGQAEMEADDLRPQLLDHRADAPRRTARGWRR